MNDLREQSLNEVRHLRANYNESLLELAKLYVADIIIGDKNISWLDEQMKKSACVREAIEYYREKSQQVDNGPCELNL